MCQRQSTIFHKLLTQPRSDPPLWTGAEQLGTVKGCPRHKHLPGGGNMSPWVHRTWWKSQDAAGLGCSEQEIGPAVASLGQGLTGSRGLTLQPGMWSSGGCLGGGWPGTASAVCVLRALELSQGKGRDHSNNSCTEKNRVQSLFPMQ